MLIRGIDAFLRMLADAGVRYIFGNPGTTELPLNDALLDEPRLKYILGLQEVPVMAMADGYAMASGKPGVVNLHISCGLGNAMGMLYNAFREGTPLLVTAGQTDRRLKFQEPILWGDMVSVARPWTKWSVEVDRVEDLPSALRRAVQLALTPPTGPVFLSIPLDVQLATADLDIAPAAKLNRRIRPPIDAVLQAVDVLLAAKNPAILAGSRVLEGDAVRELVTVAERLGAPVISEPGYTHGRLAFPCDHPLYAKGLPFWSPEIHERLAPFDVLLVVGMDLLREYVYHEPSRAIPQSCRIVQLDEDPYQLGKNYPLEVGLVGDCKAGLAEIDSEMARLINSEQRQASRHRLQRWEAAHAIARRNLRDEAAAQRDARPMTPLTLMETLSGILPADVAVIEEAVTTTNTTFEQLAALKNTSGYFGHRGWALGWGLGVALGAKLAWPNRPVLGLLGDGATLYGIQGLWSAAKYRIPATFVVCNNAQYRILKIGAGNMGLPHAQQGEYLGLDMTEPEVDIVAMARALGVDAHRITEPDELAARVAQSLSGDKPQLFDVPIARDVPGRLG